MQKIKQAPITSEKLGHKLRRFENCTSRFEIFYDAGRKKFNHGLSKEEQERVEAHYGRSFENPNDLEFWSNINFEIKHDVEPVDMENPPDLLKVRAFQALKSLGNFNDIISGDSTSDFMLTDESKETELEATLYEKRDLAIAKLIQVKQSTKYCIGIAKFLLPGSIKISTLDDAYTKIRQFLDGKIIKGSNEAIRQFNNACDLPKDELYVTVDFNEALRKNIIRKNADGKFHNPLTGTEYGKTSKQSIMYLMQPSNQEEIGAGGKSDKPYSIRYQLMNK
jgi:hypothetical protein